MAKVKSIHKFIRCWKAIFTIVLFFALALGQEVDKESLKDYRIEVVIDTIQKENYLQTEGREIRFISSDGKILKTMPYKNLQDRIGVFISPYLNCLIKANDTPAVWGKDSLGQSKKTKEARVEFTYINAKGEEKWKKNFQIIYTLEETDEDDVRPYFFNFSQDGGKIVFVRNHGVTSLDYLSDIIVLDTLGNEVASVHDYYSIENSGSLEISPDGKIIGAEVFPRPESLYQRTGKHLLFFDVEKGSKKLVKAEGEANAKKWSASFTLYKNKEIHLIGGWYHIKTAKPAIITSFDELPDDLLVLFK